MTPQEAYYKAEIEGPEDLTRNIACQDAWYAYKYARWIDKKPCKQTRDAACKGAHYAYKYAIYVDKRQCRQTRDAACQEALCAYYYAIEVDKLPTNETWRAVMNTEYEKDYENWFDEKESK